MSDVIGDLIAFVQKNHPNVVVKGSKVLHRRGKTSYLIRAKDESGKTIRFISGEEYSTPQIVTTSPRKRIGKGYPVEKS